MSDSPMEMGSWVEPVRERTGERLFHVMPEGGGFIVPADNEVDLNELWNVIWDGNWLKIACTMVFAVGSVFYALAQTQWYRSEILLALPESGSAPAPGQLGGLAGLAGFSVGRGESAEAIATLRSWDLIHSFIEEFDLIPGTIRGVVGLGARELVGFGSSKLAGYPGRRTVL